MLDLSKNKSFSNHKRFSKMKFSLVFLFLFLIYLVGTLSLVSASSFGYNNPNLPNAARGIKFLQKGGDSTTGSYNFNGGWLSNGLSIIGGSKTTLYGGIGGGGGKISLQGGRGRDAAHNPSSYAPILLQSNGGNVGIGTTSPDRLFEIFGSASVFRFRDSGATASATTAFIEFGGTDGGNWNRTGYIGDGSSGNTDLYFQAEEGDLRLGDSTSHSVLILSGGNATFSGNVTAENVWLPTYLFAHTNVILPVLSSGEWVNVTFDEEVTAFKSYISHTHNDETNTTFTIQNDGIYNIDFKCVFQDSAASPNAHVITRVLKNNVEVDGSLIELDSSKQYADTIISNSNILFSGSTGDEIVLQFTSDDTTISLANHQTYGDHGDSVTVTIERIG